MSALRTSGADDCEPPGIGTLGGVVLDRSAAKNKHNAGPIHKEATLSKVESSKGKNQPLTAYHDVCLCRSECILI